MCDWYLIGGFGIEIEDNITAIEQQIFEIEVPPVPILRDEKQSSKNLRKERNLVKSHKKKLKEKLRCEDHTLVGRVKEKQKLFDERLKTITAQIQEYDLMMSTARLD